MTSVPPSWRNIVAAYATPNWRKSLSQFLVTATPFAAMVVAIAAAVNYGVWAALLLTVPLGAFLVRLFIIQHDCGHGSYFRQRWANDWLGRMIGIATLTPYGFWHRAHALHHAYSGNLDKRGIGDITTLTRDEYLLKSAWQRFVYRLYRHPAVMFGIGPIYVFWVRHRLPLTHPRRDWRSWLSVLGTNAAIAAVLAGLAYFGILRPFLIAYVPAVLVAGVLGVWLFYVQHQFDDAYWESGTRWSFESAAFKGCSFYDLPWPLHWVTCHIGFHHIHHLCSRIPNYRLRECFEQNPPLQKAKRVTFLESLRYARLALWDENKRKLISFRQIHAQRSSMESA